MLLFWALGSWKCMSVAQLYKNLEGHFQWAKGSLYLFLRNWNGSLGLLSSFFSFLNRDYISESTVLMFKHNGVIK